MSTSPSNDNLPGEQAVAAAEPGNDEDGGQADDGPAPNNTGPEAAVIAKIPPMSHHQYPVDEDLFHSVADHPLEAHEEEGSYEEPAPEQFLPPLDFKPFFTLIEDPEIGEHHHPSVHYVFSDDDQDVLTDAALTAIGQATGSSVEAEERIILIDISASGKTVASATSLSPRWQNLKTTIGQAPSWGDDGADRGLMLKVSGQELAVKGTQQGHRAAGMEELIRAFGERLEGLGEIIGLDGDMGATGQAEAVQL